MAYHFKKMLKGQWVSNILWTIKLFWGNWNQVVKLVSLSNNFFYDNLSIWTSLGYLNVIPALICKECMRKLKFDEKKRSKKSSKYSNNYLFFLYHYTIEYKFGLRWRLMILILWTNLILKYWSKFITDMNNVCSQSK